MTSDHGEGLGEHGHAHHASDLYSSQTHVPLVVTGPGIATRRVRETVSLTSLAPTLLELAGFEPPGMPAMDGVSLAPLLTGARAEIPDGGEAYLVMVKDRSVARTQRALVLGKWKIITDADGTLASAELYDVRADRDELNNLATRESAVLTRMHEALLERMRTIDTVPGVR